MNREAIGTYSEGFMTLMVDVEFFLLHLFYKPVLCVCEHTHRNSHLSVPFLETL